jgi:phosphohistidine phosphatase
MPAGHERIVVLVRHGEAVDSDRDPARPLSELGRAHAESAAAWLAVAEPRLVEIRHSGKLRALETAQILAKRLGVGPSQLSEVAGLAPGDDVEPVAAELEIEQQSVILVGHLPFMGRLASRLLTGDPSRLAIRFVDAAVLLLAPIEGRWHLIGMFSHDLG